MNFSMQIVHLNGEPRSSALCFQAADTSGESKKTKQKKKPEWFASVSLLQSSFVGVWSGGWKPAAVWTKPLKKASAIRNSQ